MLSYFFSDRDLPLSIRHVNGYSGNTYCDAEIPIASD
jgi:hypothetical protein